MMAMMFVASATAFAGDSDALKAIKKAKTYDEAAQLLKTAQLANDEEKAAAYNKLVDLAMNKVTKEIGTKAQNQANQQLGTGKMEPFDTLGMGDALCNAINAALECNKYDQLPNAKGKVAPKYNKKNAERIWPLRTHLIEAGQDLYESHGHGVLLKFWGAFVDSSSDPFFAEQNHEYDDKNIGQIAYYAGRYAYEAKDMARADKYFEIAMRDPERKQEALNYKIYAHRSSLVSKADTLQFIETLKGLYTQDPENEAVLVNLYNIYDEMKDKAAQTALLDNHLAKYPNSYIALANKGVMELNQNNPEEGAKWLRKAVAANPENASVSYYLGLCLNQQAGSTDDQAKRKELFQEAVKAFDRAKELDPDKQQANWGYNRYQAYYSLYGEDDPRTKAAQADMR